MAKNKKPADQLPDDPAEFQLYVLREVFDNSPAAMGRAAGVSRAAVNKWLAQPPAALNAYMKKAIEHELAVLEARHAKVAEIEVRAKMRADKMRDALEKILRKMDGKK